MGTIGNLRYNAHPVMFVGQTRAQAVFLQEGGVPAKCAILGAMAAAHILVRCPAEIKHRLSRVWRATSSEGFAFVSAKFRARNEGDDVGDEERLVQERTVAAPPSCVSKPRGSAITRSDAYAVVVAKLGFNPLSSGPFSPSRHLAIHGGALISNVLFESWLQGHLSILGQRSNSVSGCFPPATGHGWPICRESCPLASRIKALVWHDECMVEDV